jgi:hypothetical protein
MACTIAVWRGCRLRSTAIWEHCWRSVSAHHTRDTIQATR